MKKEDFKLRKKLALLTAFLLLVPFSLFSATLTLEEALESARENNISLETARVSLEQVIRNQNNIWSTFMPSLNANGSLGTSYNFPSSENSFSGLTWSAGISASFTFNGSMISDGKSRSLAKEAAYLSYDSALNSLEAAVTQAYFQLSALEAALESATITLSDAEESYNTVKAQYENGTIDELTLFQSELAYNQAALNLKTAEDSIYSSKEAFRNMTGVEGDFTLEPLPTISPLSLPSAEELYEEYGENSLSIRSARNTLLTAENTKNSAIYSTYIPTIGVSASYSGSYNDKTDSFNNGISGSVSVSIPLSSMLPGGTGYSSVRNASDAVTIASLSLLDAQNTLLETINSELITIRQSQENREITLKTLENAEKSYLLTQEAFEAGLVSAESLALSRSSYLSANLSLISLEVNHILSCYSLAQTLNISIDSLIEKYSLEN